MWVGSTWISYVDNANFRRFWTKFYSAASFLLRSVHCSNHDSSLFSVAVAAADLHSSQSQYASRAPPVPTHPVVCVSSLSHMKEVCVPSHNPLEPMFGPDTYFRCSHYRFFARFCFNTVCFLCLISTDNKAYRIYTFILKLIFSLLKREQCSRRMWRHRCVAFRLIWRWVKLSALADGTNVGPSLIV